MHAVVHAVAAIDKDFHALTTAGVREKSPAAFLSLDMVMIMMMMVEVVVVVKS